MDVLRASSRKYAAPALMGDPPSEPLQTEHLLDGCEHDPKILAMFRRAECVRETVRSRVKPETWEVFRLVAIEGFTVSQSAEILGKAYTTVFRSYKRVSQLVADERLRQQNLAGESSPQS
jgi:DNA-directed RNA polymerase specialized sigma24 family protein